MDREPQDTRLTAGPGPGAQGSPPLREFQPATDVSVADAPPPSDAPWSAFVARILRPATSNLPPEPKR